MATALLLTLVTGLGIGPVRHAPAVAAVGLDDTLPAPARLTWRPERPTQGTLLVLRVTPAAGVRLGAVSGQAGGEALHFYPAGDGALESLAPVPVDAADSVMVSLTVGDGLVSADSLSAAIPVSPRSFHHEELSVAPELGSPLSEENQARLARDQAKARRVSAEAERTKPLWTPEAVLPRNARVTSGFGDGRIFNGQVSSRHMGLDLDGEAGDTVVAAARGVVELVDRFLLAGNIVYLNHGAGLISGYFHLSEALVQKGDTVEAGTPIGLVGATGRVTGPHLHWVVRYGTTSLDPRSLIPALEAATLRQRRLERPRPEDTEIWEPVPAVVTPDPAPERSAPPSDALVLFDGSSLDAWVNVRDGAPAGWSVAGGVMTVVKSAGSIRTRRRFRDYQLHLEWRIPEDVTGKGQERGNSGVYLAFLGEEQGGYELQVLDSYRNQTYVNGMAGSIYKQSIPLVNPSRPPGQWQSYDVVWTAPTFAADGSLRSPARVTVLFNGVLVQNDFELRGVTKYIGSPEYHAHGAAPIMLQAHGDPSPPISFRNIWVRELSGPLR